MIGHKKEALPRGSVPSGEPLAYNGDAPESGRFFGMVNVLGVAELLAAGGINDKKKGDRILTRSPSTHLLPQTL